MMSSSKRHFTVVIGNKEHGLYISSTPSSAARKAVSKLCADNKKKKVEFCMRETTQVSNKKVYGPYLGKMKKLDKPIKLKGRIIQYAVNVHLKKKSSTTRTTKKVGNKLRGGRIEENGHLEAIDFIYPIEYLSTSFAKKIKKRFFSKNATCFFILPKKSSNETEIYYKYAVYYSNKLKKIIIKEFDGIIAINEIDIDHIPHDVDGDDFLKALYVILQNNQDQPPDFPDFINKVRRVLEVFEPSDFIFPIESLSTDISIRIKENQKCFFIVPKKAFIPSEQKYVTWYKYAAYYSNKHNKPIIMTFDIVSKQIIKKDIEEIPNDSEGYEFLRALKAILPSNQNQPPDFIQKVDQELYKRKNKIPIMFKRN